MPAAGKHGVELSGVRACAIPDQELNAVAREPNPIRTVRAACVVQRRRVGVDAGSGERGGGPWSMTSWRRPRAGVRWSKWTKRRRKPRAWTVKK